MSEGRFGGLDPQPCPRCKSMSGLRFVRWLADVDRTEYLLKGGEKIARRIVRPAQAQFQCAHEGYVVSVDVGTDWRPPDHWR